MARGRLRFPGDQVKERAEDEERNEAAAAFGLLIEEPEPQQPDSDDDFYLWPENADTFNLWCVMQTQWNVGMSGATGMNYAGVKAGFEMRGIKKKAIARHFVGFQAMESATIEEWAKKR